MVSKSTAIGLVTAVLVGGCGASGSSDGGGGFAPDGGGQAPALGSTEAGPATCGDRACSAGETCATCALDCGECAKCALAPTCSNALGIPTTTTTRPDLNQGVPSDPDAGADGGAPTALPGADGCALPELRLRIAKVTVHKGGGPIYCIISSNDGVSSEAALTMKTKDLGNEESNYFDPQTSMFWGQTALHPTENNLTVTYNCYIVKSDA